VKPIATTDHKQSGGSVPNDDDDLAIMPFTFPEQDLRSLHGHGIYCPSQWGMPYVPLRYLFNNSDGVLYLVNYNHILTCAGSQTSRLLSNFAGICQVLMNVSTNEDADALEQAIGLGLITRLLDMPSLAGLHTRLTYIEELHDYLRRHIAATETITGNMTYTAIHTFVRGLREELLRRREVWKAELRTRCPVTPEQLVAVVWHPRHVFRHLEAAAGDDAAEEFLMRGWTYESVGRGGVAAPQ